MPYKITKRKCKQSDGDRGSYVLSYTDKKGKKHSACHTSKKKARGQIAAIEGPREALAMSKNEEFLLREIIRSSIRVLREGSSLSPAEMEKYDWRWQKFIDKMNNRTPFTHKNNKEFIIPVEGNEILLQALNNRDKIGYKIAFDMGIKTIPFGAVDSSSDIKKTSEFGGKGAHAGVTAETAQIAQINRAIDAAIEKNEGMPVDIVVGLEGYNTTGLAENVVRCEKVDGTPKADAVLKDENDKPVAYISLKAAKTPKQMNQWSGVSKYSDIDIVKQFAEDVKKWIEENGKIPSGSALARPIAQSHKLALDATFGDTTNDKNNCDIIIADKGTIKLEGEGKLQEFVCDNIWYAREPIKEADWIPTFYARAGDRSDFDIPGVRIGIFPFGYRDGSKRIII